VRGNLAYLSSLERYIHRQQRRKSSAPAAEPPDIEAFGKSRILMNGLADELHRRNLQALLRPNARGRR
jgi:hypothetical protein